MKPFAVRITATCGETGANSDAPREKQTQYGFGARLTTSRAIYVQKDTTTQIGLKKHLAIRKNNYVFSRGNVGGTL